MVHLHDLLMCRVSDLKIGTKKRSTSTTIFLHPSLNGLLCWGKPIHKFLINVNCLSQQKWRDLAQPLLRYRHTDAQSGHSDRFGGVWEL